MPPLAMASVAEITRFVEKEAQTVDIVHSHVNDNTCLRISDQPFSTSRRETPAYSKLLAISNTYGYMVAGTPTGLSVFKTSAAEAELAKGESRGTNTAVSLSARKEIDLSRFGQPTHVGVSADELQVLVATIGGSILVFSAASLLAANGDTAPTKSISVGEAIRDLRANPQELPTAIAVLTLAGDVLIADLADGSLKKIVSSGEIRITSICWSRKGKQIVCGDTNATLTQRLPTDGTIKRTIKPQTDDGGIVDGSAILAVDWIDTYTFFAVYGLVPSGAFTPGAGGGGDGSNTEDDGFEQNMTSAYVVTQASKLAPLQWLSVEDPCSSMMCPTRYPGFHIASISDWGVSAQNILIMAGTSSDATMTIGQAATRDPAASSADGNPELEWAMWDIDGAMAVMPLSAINTDLSDTVDTYPIGMAVDYTCKRDLPPVLDDGGRVSPVPVLWILNTDACLLGYHICNTYEMKRNARCPLMVDQVKPLPGAVSPEPTFAQATAAAAAEPAKAAPFAPAKAFGGAFGSAASSSSAGAFGKPPTSTPGSFGAAAGFAPSFGSSSATPAFGKSSTIAPVVKPPTALSVTGQHVFGSTSKSGVAPTAFGGFGATALPAGKSIFDAPASSGPSIFDASDKPNTASPFGAATSMPGPSTFGTSDKAKAASPFAVAASALSPSKGIAAPSTLSFSGLGLPPAKDVFGAKLSDNTPASVSFGSAPKQSLGVATGSMATNLFDSVKKPSSTTQPLSERAFGSALPSMSISEPVSSSSSSLAPSRSTKLADKERQEAEKRVEAEKRKDDEKRKEAARALELERCNEQARLDALERELEEKSQALISHQYIATCNSFDHNLKAFALSVKETESAIARVRSACLPPIPLNATVQSMASLSSSPRSLAIDDTESWNRISDVLLEALRVSRDELRASQKNVAEQSSGYLKTETKREEIRRILDSASSTMSLPNSTIDGGLTPLQRDCQRRLKSAFALVERQYADVQAKADRIKDNGQGLLPSLRAPTFDNVRRTLLNVTNTVHQKSAELDGLTALVDGMAIDDPADHRRRSRQRKAALPSATNSPARHRSQTQSTGGTDAASLRTAAAGVPWSPEGLPFSTPSFGRREGGFGLSLEDLASYDQPADLGPTAALQLQQSLGNPRHTDAIGANPNFPHTQVRELAPRSSKANRKASLVLDSEPATPGRDIFDGASVASTSAFSGAAAYIQARRKRSLVRDALTRSNRTAALIHSPESATTRAYKFGSLSSSIVPEPVPMPNLERYVQVFGKLKIDEPSPIPEPEPEPEQKPEAQQALPLPAEPISHFGLGARGAAAGQWQCSVCDLMSPDSSVACIVCESSRPGSMPAPPPPPPTISFSGFKPSGGLSLASLAAALGPSSSSTSAPTGTPLLSFPSFAPPSGTATAQPAATPAPAFSGFKPSSGFSLSQPSAALAGSALSFGTAAKPAPSFTSFVPPAGMAPALAASAAGSASLAAAAVPALPVGNEASEMWTCEVCELKSPSHATACIVCEAPRPTASDSEESGADELADEQYSDEEEDHSDGSAEATESDWTSDEEAELESDIESDIASDAESDAASDASGADDDAIDSGEMSDPGSASHPVLSYADAAKVALADNSAGEEADLEEKTTTPPPNHLAEAAETTAVANNDNAPVELELTISQAGEQEHDHDSDGFVHISQSESGMQSNVNISQIVVDDDALSAIASETSLDTSANAAPSTGEHVSELASDIDHDVLGQSEASDTESKIFAAVSDELDRGISELPVPASEDQPQSAANVPVPISDAEAPTQPFSLAPYLVQLLSGPSVTRVVEHALSSRPMATIEPAPAVEDIAPVAAESTEMEAEAGDAESAALEAVAPQPDDAELPSGPVIAADLPTPPNAPTQQQGEAAPALDLGDLAAGIASALGDAAVAVERTSEEASTEHGQQTCHPRSPATGMPNAKSFFKAGRLGNFGSQLGKSAFGASSGTSTDSEISPSSGPVLPKAFSASASTATPTFGAKLDRPAFGIASMSSFGAGSQSRQQPAAKPLTSFAGMSIIGSGFSSRASPSIDPFAAYKSASNVLGTAEPAADESSSKPPSQPGLDGNSPRMSGLDSSPRQAPKPGSKPAIPQPTAKAADPILSIIHGSDSEEDKDDLDVNYDSE